MGTGLNFTKTKLHENRVARVHKITRSQIFTKPSLHEGTKFHEGTKLHEDDFAQVTFLHENKKKEKKKIIN